MDISWPTINNIWEFIAVIILVVAASIWKVYDFKVVRAREKRRDYELSLIKTQNDNIISMLMLFIKQFVGVVDENLMRLIYGVYLDRATIKICDLIEAIQLEVHSDRRISNESIMSWVKRDIGILYENDRGELKGFLYKSNTLDTFVTHDVRDSMVREAYDCIMDNKSIKNTKSIIQQTFNEQKNIIMNNALSH